MHRFGDGVDSKAGTTDDVLDITRNVLDPLYASDWDHFSNATFDFGTIFTSMEQIILDSPGTVLRDGYNHNQSLQYGGTARPEQNTLATTGTSFWMIGTMVMQMKEPSIFIGNTLPDR